MSSSDTWVYDAASGVYYHAPSNTYAVPDPTTGQWSYIPAPHFHHASSSTGFSNPAPAQTASSESNNTGGFRGKEEGEVEDDVGWGGLMEPEQLAEIQRTGKLKEKGVAGKAAPAAAEQEMAPYGDTPSYDDPALYAYQSGADEILELPKERPDHLLRLVVQATASPKVVVGQVAVIDSREGGVQLGRDRCERGAQARVRLRELEVSKTHAVVYWTEESQDEHDQEGWRVVDLGSTHGTFISTPLRGNEMTAPYRLSEPKHSSKPVAISHLSTLTIGSTTFEAHIHSSWPCDACKLCGTNELSLETGEVPVEGKSLKDKDAEEQTWDVAMSSREKWGNRDARRKVEMANLKENLMKRNGGGSGSNSPAAEPAREYIDRSAMRRQLRPKSPPRKAATPATSAAVVSAAPAPVQSKFAQGMLAKQGWQEGSGLGKDETGRAVPLDTQVRIKKRGLGAEGSVDDGDGDWRTKAKMRRWGEVRKG
ncbi:hypothetical protein I350_04225 [Cryptococcus amylolentus CBS 6273]|uniref:G-patch domain-containing protein n=1 Tax=Cryptococcus amylolentus CBS 6273 TaxID=1296118 RepID=A0A1E3K1F7_9TREE|nr:hypothetical protein I350_04225 [Cryptococcus amylolentus CBS 6273]